MLLFFAIISAPIMKRLTYISYRRFIMFEILMKGVKVWAVIVLVEATTAPVVFKVAWSIMTKNLEKKMQEELDEN